MASEFSVSFSVIVSPNVKILNLATDPIHGLQFQSGKESFKEDFQVLEKCSISLKYTPKIVYII